MQRTDLVTGLIIWLVVAAATLLIHRRACGPGTGLVAAFLAGIWLIHWPGALLYTLPWYAYEDRDLVQRGFQQSVYAVLGFGAGVLLLALLRARRQSQPDRSVAKTAAFPARTYLVIGLLSYLVFLPLFGQLPTLSAIISMSTLFVVVGLALFCWRAWQRGDMHALVLWLLAGLLIPLFTMLAWGFLSFGATALLALITFVAGFIRIRARVVLAMLLVAYVGLSFYVTYMRDRLELRSSVWGGESVGQRLDQSWQMITGFEWFDLSNLSHLRRIDERINQNTLLGSAVLNLSTGYIDYARGETLSQAVTALVPRALWPDKPIRAGGNALMTEYTGLDFDDNTSVGLGQVMELYINFGTAGVGIGFFVLGLVIAWFDRAAALALQRDNWQAFAFWYLSGIGMLQINGALFEISASVAAGMVAVLLVNRLVLPVLAGSRPSGQPAAGPLSHPLK